MNRSQWIHHQVESWIQEAGSRDPFIIAEQRGIYLSFRDLGKIKGFFWQVLEEQHIVLNQNLSEEGARLVCAHELGHAALHAEWAQNQPFAELQLYSAQGSRAEFEANLFAADLLLEDGIVLDQIHEETHLNQLATALECPAELVLFKLKQFQRRGYDIPLPGTLDSQCFRHLMLQDSTGHGDY